jgi:hypothetical protein
MNIRLGLVVAACALQNGCFLFTDDLEKCREVREYQQSNPAPRIIVPDDLEQLPDASRLQVPYGEANKQATPEADPCLIEPPDYFDDSSV